MPVPADSHGLPGVSYDIVFVLRSCWLEIKTCKVVFLLFIPCQHSCWPSKWTFVPVSLSSLCPYDSCAAVSVLCLVVIQVLLFFYIWQFHWWLQSCPLMTSMATVPSVPPPLLMASQGVHTLREYIVSHHLVLPIVSLVPFGLSMLGSIALMVMHMPGISSSLFVSWLCLDSQSAMNCCCTDVYSILMLHWQILNPYDAQAISSMSAQICRYSWLSLLTHINSRWYRPQSARCAVIT